MANFGARAGGHDVENYPVGQIGCRVTQAAVNGLDNIVNMHPAWVKRVAAGVGIIDNLTETQTDGLELAASRIFAK
jgi:hypothetical protein